MSARTFVIPFNRGSGSSSGSRNTVSNISSFFHLGVGFHLAALREVVAAKNLPEEGELGERQLGHRDGESPRRLQVVYRLVRHRQVIIKYLENTTKRYG